MSDVSPHCQGAVDVDTEVYVEGAVDRDTDDVMRDAK